MLILGVTIGTAFQPASAAAGQQQAPHETVMPVERSRTYDGPLLPLQDALSQALSSNPDLLVLRARFNAARHAPAEERYLPPPTFEAQIWQWPIDTFNPADTNMYMLMVEQEIPGRGKRPLREALARKDVELAENQIATRARQVIEKIKRSYAELYVTRKDIDLHLASVALLREFADISEAKYATGRISQQDLLKAVVEISKFHEHLVTLEQQEAQAVATLNALLGRDPATPIGPLPDPGEGMLTVVVGDLQRMALAHQPELRGAALAVERAQASLAVTDQEYRPDFFVQAGYMAMPGDRDAWTARFGISWPTAPWSKGRLDARKAAGVAEIEAAKAERRAVENATRLAVHDAYVRVLAAERRAVLLRSSVVPQSQQTLEVSRVAYQTDRVDFLSLVDNQRVLLDAQLGYYRALSDREQALADLERAVGKEVR